jgi:hypothetical protein|tara:strand:- start:29 stop:139 length:111 start_codon:yes stop_codon:yes gene_type:complete
MVAVVAGGLLSPQEEVAVLGVVEMGQTHPQTRKTVL